MKICTICNQEVFYRKTIILNNTTEKICRLCKKRIYKQNEDGKMERINFNRVQAIPAPKGMGIGRVTARTTECIKELASMEVGDIIHIPITETVEEGMRRRVQNGYVGSLDTARKSLTPRQFKIARRGKDIFIERLPN